jgi:hypothetical protein
MAWPVSDAYVRALGDPHGLFNEVQVWSPAGLQVGSLPFTDGSVTDEWVSGARRSLSLSVIPSASTKLMVQPGNELRVFSGIRFAGGSPERVPMGRFPIVERTFGLRSDPVSLSMIDRWLWVQRADFQVPTATTVGLTIQGQVARFIADTNRWKSTDVQQLATSQSKIMTAQVFDTAEGGRAQACFDLLELIGAEVFIDRLGMPVIRDRPSKGVVSATFTGGNGNRLKDLSESVSVAQVFNSVRVVPTTTDPAFAQPAYQVSITDPNNAAYPRNGEPYRVKQVESANFDSRAQVVRAAEAMLSRVSRWARQLEVTAVDPDPARDASDTVSVTLSELSVAESAQVQTVTHPLTGGGSHVLTTVSTRSDEDFNL